MVRCSAFLFFFFFALLLIYLVQVGEAFRNHLDQARVHTRAHL